MNVSEAEIGQLSHDFDWLLALPEMLAHRYHEGMTQFEEERDVRHLSTAERIGEKNGRREQAIAMLLIVGSKRFGPPDDKTKTALEKIISIKRLEMLALRLLDVETWQELLQKPTG
jgi:hypothetical protein